MRIVSGDKAIQAIQATMQGKNLSCPSCHGVSFGVNPIVFEYREFLNGVGQAEVDVYPVILVNCKNCGYVLTFGAKHLGLV